MKQFILFISILTMMAFSLAEEKKPIEYNERNELTWKDNHARSNKSSYFKALTVTKITFKGSSNGKIVQLSIKNTFEPHNSWTKNKESNALLEHERLHFHISELYARKLRKEILETEFTAREQKLMNEISRLYEDKMKELSQYQRQYDRETDHSTIEEKQNEWELKIKSELIALKRFAYHTIEMEL